MPSRVVPSLLSGPVASALPLQSRYPAAKTASMAIETSPTESLYGATLCRRRHVGCSTARGPASTACSASSLPSWPAQRHIPNITHHHCHAATAGHGSRSSPAGHFFPSVLLRMHRQTLDRDTSLPILSIRPSIHLSSTSICSSFLPHRPANPFPPKSHPYCYPSLVTHTPAQSLLSISSQSS